jgi:hypothetical protein
MATDATHAAKIKEWAMSKSTSHGCSWCGGTDFDVVSEHVELHDRFGSPLHPMVAIECTGCHQTFLFSSRVI